MELHGRGGGGAAPGARNGREKGGGLNGRKRLWNHKDEF